MRTLPVTVLYAVVIGACSSSSDDSGGTLTSTWDLPVSGVDAEVPILQARVRVAIPEENRGTALSPDGDRLALVRVDTNEAGSSVGTVIFIYDTRSGDLLQELRTSSIDRLQQQSLSWSADDRLTVLGARTSFNDRWVTWDPNTGEVVSELDLSAESEPCDELGFGRALAFNPEESLLAKTERSVEGGVVLCRYDLRNLVVDISSELDVPGFVGRPIFSPDGQRLAFTWYSSENSSVGIVGTQVVDADTLQPTGEVFPPEDGRITVLGDDFHVGLQEIGFGDELVIIPGYSPIDSSFGTITADPGARVLASVRPDYSFAGDDDGIRLITLPEGIVIGDVFETDDELRTFSADGSTIAVANEAFMDVYSLESRTLLTALPIASTVP